MQSNVQPDNFKMQKLPFEKSRLKRYLQLLKQTFEYFS